MTIGVASFPSRVDLLNLFFLCLGLLALVGKVGPEELLCVNTQDVGDLMGGRQMSL